jgi:hypothetical protein
LRFIKPAAAAGLIVALLSGCSSEPNMTTSETPQPSQSESRSPWTHATAERRAVQLVTRIETAMPGTGITSRKQASGSQLACGPNSTQWSGGATISYDAAVDFEKLFAEVSEAFPSTDGWKATVADDRFGDPSLAIRNEHHETYLVSQYGVDTVNIVSFSPCYPT